MTIFGIQENGSFFLVRNMHYHTMRSLSANAVTSRGVHSEPYSHTVPILFAILLELCRELRLWGDFEKHVSFMSKLRARYRHGQ